MILKKIIYSIFLFFVFSNSFSQKKDCNGQLSLARDFFNNGKFSETLFQLDQYKECVGVKNSEYFKLKALIYLATDEISEAKLNIAAYISSKGTGNFSNDDSQLFKDIYNTLLDSINESYVTSVSKKPEDIDLVTASIIIIKESEFSLRGYTDLVDLIMDQPGFDVSKIYGINYAQIYQRGFRQENTERTLFMIDGIEENDAWSNIAYLSRQYPLSNINSVEIIYGPASTVYGPRAFVGAINVITKTHMYMLDNSPKTLKKDSLTFKIKANMQAGSYNSKCMDINIGAKYKKTSLSLTTKFNTADLRDLSYISFWDYKLNDLDNLNYNGDILKNLSYSDTSILKKLGLNPGNPLRNYFSGYSTSELKINSDSLSSLINMAKKIDKEKYIQQINGNQIGFSNSANYYYISAKIRTDNLEAGIRTWKCHEATNIYQDLFIAGSKNGSSWEPMNTTFYSKYKKNYKNLIFSNTNSYAIYSLGKESIAVTFNGLYNLFNKPSSSPLSFFSIVFPDSTINNYKPGWYNKFHYYKATQFINDFRINYSKNKVDFFSSFEIRHSLLPGDFLTYENIAGQLPINQTLGALAQNQGTVTGQSKGSNQYNILDLGFCSQLTYILKDSVFYLTAGARLDNNKIRSNEGFGRIINPKLAFVWVQNKIINKLILSSGVQNASNWTKYSTGGGRTPNGLLEPEKINNLEFIIQNKHTRNYFKWDVAVFYSIINNAISSGIDPLENKKKNINNGEYDILGLQANINYLPSSKPFNIYSNFTFTKARQTDNNLIDTFEVKTIGDIAPFKANMILNYYTTIKKHFLNFNLRANYVGNRPVGYNTTLNQSTGLNGSNNIPAYLVFFGTLTYKNPKYQVLTFQLTVNNILNRNILNNQKDYYHPGPRTASGNYNNSYQGEVPYVPQNNRNFLISIFLKV